MRGYALVLGIVLTVGYGCVAQMAVSSVAVRQEAGARPARAPVAAPDTVWCGGTLTPVVVEAPGVPTTGSLVTRFGRAI